MKRLLIVTLLVATLASGKETTTNHRKSHKTLWITVITLVAVGTTVAVLERPHGGPAMLPAAGTQPSGLHAITCAGCFTTGH